jgi:hypothetical protein
VEAKATLLVAGVLMVLAVVSAALLAAAVRPAVDVFLAYLALAVRYAQTAADPSPAWIIVSLSSSLLLVFLDVAIVAVTAALLLARVQTIFRKRFGDGVPLAAHHQFWTWGVAGALWAQALPVLYIVAAAPAMRWFVERSVDTFLVERGADHTSWSFLLTTGPTMLLITFLLVAWVGRGLASLRFLARFEVQGEPYAALHLIDESLSAAPAH